MTQAPSCTWKEENRIWGGVFLQSILGNAAQSQNPLPRALPTRTRFYQSAPGEGRGAALMSWFRVTSAHPGWRCYQSPCRFRCKATLLALKQDECFVSARFKGTAKVLAIKMDSLKKKKKLNLMTAGFPREQGSCLPSGWTQG